MIERQSSALNGRRLLAFSHLAQVCLWNSGGSSCANANTFIFLFCFCSGRLLHAEDFEEEGMFFFTLKLFHIPTLERRTIVSKIFWKKWKGGGGERKCCRRKRVKEYEMLTTPRRPLVSSMAWSSRPMGDGPLWSRYLACLIDREDDDDDDDEFGVEPSRTHFFR